MTTNSTKAETDEHLYPHRRCAGCGEMFETTNQRLYHQCSGDQPGAVEPPERIWLNQAIDDGFIQDIWMKQPIAIPEKQRAVEYARVQPEQSGERQLIEHCAQRAFDAVKAILEPDRPYTSSQIEAIAATMAANVSGVGQDDSVAMPKRQQLADRIARKIYAHQYPGSELLSKNWFDSEVALIIERELKEDAKGE